MLRLFATVTTARPMALSPPLPERPGLGPSILVVDREILEVASDE
jgi:hypothetical protein